MQGQLRRAVGFCALLFLPRQVVLTHGIIPVNHRGERGRGLLGRHDSAAGRGQKKDQGQEEQTAVTSHKNNDVYSREFGPMLLSAEQTF